MKNETKNVPTISVVNLINNDGIQIEFADGRALVVKLDQLSPEMVTVAALHGLKQKLVDAAAISRNPDTGRSATIDDKYAALHEVYVRILLGQWNKQREGGTGVGGGLLLAALVRLYAHKTLAELRDYLDAKTDAEKSALRVNPKIASVIETIKAERATKSGMGVVDTNAMLDELGGV